MFATVKKYTFNYCLENKCVNDNLRLLKQQWIFLDIVELWYQNVLHDYKQHKNDHKKKRFLTKFLRLKAKKLHERAV